MENEKPKRGRKTKTPANDAATGVAEAIETQPEPVADPEPAEPSPVYGFTFYQDQDGIIYGPADDPAGVTLPAVGRENEIGHWADVAFMSGYFPGKTPSQLAIQLLVGDALGLRMANALFDLEIEPDGIIRWKSRQPAAAAGDAIDVAGVNKATPIQARQDPAGVVVDISTGKPAALANGETMEITGDPIPATFPDSISVDNGPVLNPDPEPAQGVAQPPAGDSGPISAAASPELTPIGEAIDGLGFPTGEIDPFSEPAEPETPEQEFDRITAADPVEFDVAAAIAKMESSTTPAQALQDPATPEAALTAPADIAETLDGLEVGATIENWRAKIEAWLKELEFSAVAIAGKMTTFHASNTLAKKSMFEQAEILYNSRIAAKRFDVLSGLAKDGKQSVGEMAGFFTYADVPLDPETWTYADAIKAFRVIEKEFPNLLEPAPATAA
jgi:hypothetical protein